MVKLLGYVPMQLCMLSCIYIMWVLQGSAEITLYLCVCIFCGHDSQVWRPHREHLAGRRYVKRARQFTRFRFTYLRQCKRAVYGDRVISRTCAFIYWPYPAWQLQQNTSRLRSSYFKTTRQNTAGTPPISCDCRCSGWRQRFWETRIPR